MFSILRFVVIVGLIFYYSPVRQRGEGPDLTRNPLSATPATEAAAAGAATGAPGHLEAVWQALPDGAKQAVVDRILTTSGLTPPAPKSSDTLRPEDRASASHRPRG